MRSGDAENLMFFRASSMYVVVLTLCDEGPATAL